MQYVSAPRDFTTFFLEEENEAEVKESDGDVEMEERRRPRRRRRRTHSRSSSEEPIDGMAAVNQVCAIGLRESVFTSACLKVELEKEFNRIFDQARAVRCEMSDLSRSQRCPIQWALRVHYTFFIGDVT